MPSIFFDENGNATTFVLTDNLPDSYPISYDEFMRCSDIRFWKLDPVTQEPILKDASEVEAEEFYISPDQFIQELNKMFSPLELESLFTRFQTFTSFLQINDFNSLKSVLNDKVANNIITQEEYLKINTTFKKFKLDLDNL